MTLRDNAGAGYVIDAPDLGVHDALGYLDGQHHFHWNSVDAIDTDRLALVASVIETMVLDGAVPGFHATLDTRTFFSTTGARHKLGLGSSAALTVALAGAIHAHAGRGAPVAGRLIAAHRRMQGGRGSGLDVAASLTGGAIGYRLRRAAADHACGLADWPAVCLRLVREGGVHWSILAPACGVAGTCASALYHVDA